MTDPNTPQPAVSCATCAHSSPFPKRPDSGLCDLMAGRGSGHQHARAPYVVARMGCYFAFSQWQKKEVAA